MPDDFEDTVEEVVAEEVIEVPEPAAISTKAEDFYLFCKAKQAAGFDVCLRDVDGWITVLDPDNV